MIIACPQCQKKLKINARKYAGKKLSLTCRSCGATFPCELHAPHKILVAHAEPEICQTVLDICRDDQGLIQTCNDAITARDLLDRQDFLVLLLDVALPGAFPFELIDELHRNEDPVRIILLPSVYNRAAYKRRPSSLYGADAYLEIHHLSDQLIPLLHELTPGLVLKSRPFCPMSQEGEERTLSADADMQGQAEELARMLVADIALYHQVRIDSGIRHGDLEVRLETQLNEGRRMMACRIPQVELDRQDYLFAALKEFVSAREKEIITEREDSHG